MKKISSMMPVAQLFCAIALITLSAVASGGPLKVFIMAGQSNMQGKGEIFGVTPGHLEQAVLDDPATYGHLRNDTSWSTRSDVNVWYVNNGVPINGPLTIGFGSKTTQIGPELQFGHIMGNYFDDPVLIIKAAWGGKSLAIDFRPPSSGDINTQITYNPPKTDLEQGYYYDEILNIIAAFKANPAAYYPGYNASAGYEIVGFAWNQGYNDATDSNFANQYQVNLKNLIKDLRTDLALPNLSFSISTTGMEGWSQTDPKTLTIINAQLAMGNFTLYPEFSGTVAVDETRGYWFSAADSPASGGGQAYHWNQNSKSYFMIGAGLAEKMLSVFPTRLAKTIPNVVGLTQSNASSSIASAGFISGTISTRYSGTVAIGQIISQNPIAGTKKAEGSLIGMVVSLGPQPSDTTPPNPSPMTWASAPAGGFYDPLGILTAETLSGNNPATGVPWAEGDTYRLVFVTRGTRNAASNNISDYNSFVQSAANASPLGLSGVTWKVIGSTSTVDARTNTSTHPSVNGTGQAIFLLDGSTVVATSYADLWDGELSAAINMNQYRDSGLSFDVATGTNGDGTYRERHLGGSDEVPPKIEHGSSAYSDSRWHLKYSGDASSSFPYYALSSPITLVRGISMTATTATDAAGVEYYFDETSGNPGGSDSGWQDSPVYLDTGLSNGITYTYTVKARDKSSTQNTTAASGSASATTTGGSVNTAPVATAQNISTPKSTAKAITLSGTDAEGSALTYTIVTQPSHGTLSGAAPNVTYTPTTNYTGSDSFTFKVNDGLLDSAPATVSITVTDTSTGQITWGTPTTITGASNIQSAGVSNLAGANFGITTGTTTTVLAAETGSVNVEFKSLRSGQNVTLSNGVNVAAAADWENWGSASSNSAVTGNFGIVLDSNLGIESATSATITLSGLSIGTQYQIQFFADSTGTNSQTISGSGTISSLNGQFVTGTFTANATSLVLTVTRNTDFAVANALTIGIVSSTDTTAPRLTAIDCNLEAGTINPNTSVQYTLTFSEDMDASTIDSTDFGNQGVFSVAVVGQLHPEPSAITIKSITETSPGVFAVQVTPTNIGTLLLMINAGSSLKDTAGNSLDTTHEIVDDTLINVGIPNPDSAEDSDKGGLPNGIERVLGGNPTTSSDDASIAPIFAKISGNYAFTYRRSDLAYADTKTTIAVEYSSDFINWTTATPGANITITENNDYYGAGVDQVGVTFAPGVAAGGKIFVRLKAVVSP